MLGLVLGVRVDDGLVLDFILCLDDGATDDDFGALDDSSVFDFILGVGLDDGLVVGLKVDNAAIDDDS